LPDAITIAALAAGFKYVKDAVSLLKDAKDLLPAGEKREAAQRLLVEAEERIPVAEAQLAKALGYQLCRCDYPPAIMLETGQPPRPRCPKCGRVEGEAAEHRYSEEEEKVLHFLVNAPYGGIPAVVVAQNVGIAPAKAEYYLDSLSQSGMVGCNLSMAGPPEYYLEQAGKGYLVKRNLL